ncbi:unnamed protein product [Coffea canephora]|uniref:DH200=94 genomic scaffold, scaffold_325 n=1 Tax=Coffea canephora TaxID=49390 RepID=A0A068VH59_COFCA|nr:unnamed protein product [Coffea canephora]
MRGTSHPDWCGTCYPLRAHELNIFMYNYQLLFMVLSRHERYLPPESVWYTLSLREPSIALSRDERYLPLESVWYMFPLRAYELNMSMNSYRSCVSM